MKSYGFIVAVVDALLAWRAFQLGSRSLCTVMIIMACVQLVLAFGDL